MIYIYLLILAICLFAVIQSSSIIARHLINISRFLHLSEYIVSFILMAWATSMPELFVGLSSALSDKSALSFGNIIGANIVNLSLAIGLIIIFCKGIAIKDQIAKKDSWIIFCLAILPVLMAINGKISRGEGFILIALFIWYIIRLFERKESYSQKLNSVVYNIKSFKNFIFSLVIFLISIIILLISAWGAVWSAIEIAQALDISLLVIGLIIMALGTTLPEIAFGIRSSLLKHQDLSIGNAIGSVVFNSLLIVGVVAVINPIIIADFISLKLSGFFLALILLVFNLFVRTKNRLSYKEGFILLALYFVFLFFEIIISQS